MRHNPAYQSLGIASDPLKVFQEGVDVKSTFLAIVLTALLLSYSIFVYTYVLGWLYDDDMSGDDCEREALRFMFAILIMLNVTSILISGVDKNPYIVVSIVNLVINSIIYNWLATNPFNPDSYVRDMFIALSWIGIFVVSIIILALLGFDIFSIVTLAKRK